MMKLVPWISGLLISVAGATANAGMHQICYEGHAQSQGVNWYPNGIFGCSIAFEATLTPPMSARGSNRQMRLPAAPG